jgi:hypothetical protein
LKGRDSLEDLGVDGKITDVREKVWEGVDWIHVAQDREQWPALVNTVMNFRFHKRWANSWLYK